MDDRKIAKNLCRVIFTLADGKQVEGDVFLSPYEAHRHSPQRVGELLNSEEAFLPVKTANGTLQLNVANIIQAITPADEELDDLMMLGKKYTVGITTLCGKEITGEVFVDLPQGSNRVSDYLNQPQRFFPIIIPESVVYIARRFILSVRD